MSTLAAAPLVLGAGLGLAGAAACVLSQGALLAALSPQAGRAAGPMLALHLGRVAVLVVAGAALGGGLALEPGGGLSLWAGREGAVAGTLARMAAAVALVLILSAGLWGDAVSARRHAKTGPAGRDGSNRWQRRCACAHGARPGAALLRGALAALVPCPVSFSALVLAALQGSALSGAAVMAGFGLATATLLLGLALLLGRADVVHRIGLCGLALATLVAAPAGLMC